MKKNNQKNSNHTLSSTIEHDEFWNDCIDVSNYNTTVDTQTHKEKSRNDKTQGFKSELLTKHLTSLQNYDNFIKNKTGNRNSIANGGNFNELKNLQTIEPKTKSLVKTKVMNSSLVDIISKEEEYKRKGKTKAMYAQERSTHLYLKAIQKNETIKKLVKEKNEKMVQKEMEGCTFKPKTNVKGRKPKNKSVEIETSRKNKERSVKEQEKQLQEEKENCTFRPKISTLDSIVKSFREKTKYDRSSQKYFQRINKARQQENEKKQKLNPNYNLIYDRLYKKGHSKSNTITLTHENKDDYCTFNPNNSTIIDYCTHMKTLHEHLHTINVGDESTNYIASENKNKSLDI